MKVRVKRCQAVIGTLAAALLASCAAQPPVRDVIFDDQMTQLQARSIQSRTFELTDRIKTMRAVIATLQDLDFVIDRADSRLGIIVATKLKGYHLHVTVKVDDRRSGPILVRVNLVAGFGTIARAGLTSISSEVYQELFTSLGKNIFLWNRSAAMTNLVPPPVERRTDASGVITVDLLNSAYHLGDDKISRFVIARPQGKRFVRRFKIADKDLSDVSIRIWVSDLVPRHHNQFSRGHYKTRLIINDSEIDILNKYIAGVKDNSKIEQLTIGLDKKVIKKGTNEIIIIAGYRNDKNNYDDFELHRIALYYKSLPAKDLPQLASTTLSTRVSLRETPKDNLSANDINEMIRKHGFFDSSKKVTGSVYHSFVDNKDGTVSDLKTGLMWQKFGSSRTLRDSSAISYINNLNKNLYAGYSDWRIPTVEELASILVKDKANNLHLDAVFDSRAYRCWSADRALNMHGFQHTITAWVMDYKSGKARRAYWWNRKVSGFTERYILLPENYVRAVRSVKQ